METGLEVGEGNHVVLEASSEIVESIQQAMAAATAASAAIIYDDDNDTDDGGGTLNTNPTAYTTSGITTEGPSITAVVDLELLSELVGATEADLITGLHHEMQEMRAAAAAAAEEERGAEGQDDFEVIPDEETPLIPSVTVREGEEGVEAVSDARDDHAATEQITLLADPFIETLAETLPVIQEDDVMTAGGDTATLGDAITIATTTIPVAALILSGRGGEDLEGEATHVDEQQHFAHDAFLLDVPTTDEQGNMEHHFVLALPEILVEESVQTATSALSGEEAFAIMERAMSLLPDTRLPTDIENVHLEATEHIPTKADPSQVHIDVVINRRVPIVGYVILFSGLFALASVGAALDLQEGGVTPTMKTQWRQLATSLVLLPFVIKSLWQDGKPHLTISQWTLLPIAAAAYAYMTLAFVIALEMTTLANAFVLSNMTSLVIIFGRFVLGMPVLPLEGGGAITGFLGAGVCAQDAARTMANGGEGSVSVSTDGANSSELAMWGNVVALSSSFGTAAYLLIAKKLRPKMDLFVFMFMIMAFGAFFLLVFMIASGEEVSFDMDPAHGLFGWMNLQADRLPLELYMVIICNCLGTTGYIAVMKYFDPLVPATVMLLEPVVGALLGVAAGTAKLPGLQTWLGDLVVACGTFMVIYSGSSKKESIDATEALRPRVSAPGGGGGDDTTLRTADAGAIKSPLLPRHSPALSKSPASRLSRKSCDMSGGGGTSGAKVIWDV
jgi:drug/metabolite transporter (DMT)-like permease